MNTIIIRLKNKNFNQKLFYYFILKTKIKINEYH